MKNKICLNQRIQRRDNQILTKANYACRVVTLENKICLNKLIPHRDHKIITKVFLHVGATLMKIKYVYLEYTPL